MLCYLCWTPLNKKGITMILVQDVVYSDDPMFDGDTCLSEGE